MTRTAHDTVSQYLDDIHALEEQSLQQLRSAPDIAGESGLEEVLRAHLPETEGHEQCIRELLEGRGSEPSRIKEAIMRAGGEGFVLFARAQQDTPGKLCAHALSYEALEWAAYDLLSKIATEAGAPSVAETARSIRTQESDMMDRIESLFDRTVTASLRLRADGSPDDALRSYLADAHAIEAQAIQLMESGRGMWDQPRWTERMENHLEEERRHQQELEACLTELEGSRSILKDSALRMGGFNWSLFFRAQPDTAARYAAFVFAFQYLEIGGYEQLWRVAERAGRDDVARTARDILRDERRAAAAFVEGFDEAVRFAVSA